MGYSYTTRSGQRVQVKVAAQYDAMAKEFARVWGLSMPVTSGTRTNAEQWVLWRKWKNGTGNLAAYPGTSNHEEGGPTGPRALDLRDTGGDAGITVIGSRRSNWLAANCGRWGFKNAGHFFSPREGWHYEYTGALTNNTSGGKYSQEVANQQAFLNNTRGERLTVDGLLGDRTKEAISRYQTFLKAQHGYVGAIDGQWGTGTQQAHARYYDAVVSGRVVEDGKMGPGTISGLQRALGVTVDGQAGKQTWSALQTRLKAAGHNIAVDGDLGPASIRALQTFLLGAKHADGKMGPQTILGLQRYINKGGKFTVAPTSPVTTPERPVGRNATLRPTKDIQALVGAVQDGQWGKETGSKVWDWQAKNGLTPDAVWGPASDAKGFPGIPMPTSPTATKRKATYPSAKEGYTAPLTSDRTAGDVITRLILHHCAATSDQLSYFLSKNERGSAPTWYVRSNGEVIETIAPGKRPSSTGADNTGSVAIETQNSSTAPTWGITDASHESIAQIAAWLSKQTSIDGVPVSFTLDRAHIVGHNETNAGKKTGTVCPGPAMDIDRIIARAKVIANPPKPEVPTTPEDNVSVKRSWLQKLRDELNGILGK